MALISMGIPDEQHKQAQENRRMVGRQHDTEQKQSMNCDNDNGYRRSPRLIIIALRYATDAAVQQMRADNQSQQPRVQNDRDRRAPAKMGGHVGGVPTESLRNHQYWRCRVGRQHAPYGHHDEQDASRHILRSRPLWTEKIAVPQQ